MRKLLSLLMGAILLSSAAYGEAYIYLSTPQCLNDNSDAFWLHIPGFQPLPIEIRAYAPRGAQVFEFSIPGFTAEAGIQVSDVVPNPEAVYANGNPFAEGALIAFGTCQSEPVTLYTATLFVPGNGVSVRWEVARRSSPIEPGATCPTATPCGGGSASCIFTLYPSRPGIAPNNPSPADGTTGVPLHPSLGFSWDSGACFCLGVACTALYFGRDPDPPLFFGLCDMPWPELDLKPSTTYYWRVSVSFCTNDPHDVNGPVWSFTTEPPIGVEPVTWSKVKQIFR